MSGNLDKVLIVGTSAIAEEHAKALQHLGIPALAIGRDCERAAHFATRTGTPAVGGGVESFLHREGPPASAIVCAGISDLGNVARVCLRVGVRRILLEKPGGTDVADLEATQALANDMGAEVFIGYNRRFYPNVQLCQQMIEEDGGLLSFHFDFTELGPRIAQMDKPAHILAHWFEGNSTHVIDLSFFLGGEPTEMYSQVSNPLSWHPRGGIFVGHGLTESGAVFSYHANWLAPGRWVLDLRTQYRRFLFSPLETLRVQRHGSFEETSEWEQGSNSICKIGFVEQIEAFSCPHISPGRLMTLDSQRKRMSHVYSKFFGDIYSGQ